MLVTLKVVNHPAELNIWNICMKHVSITASLNITDEEMCVNQNRSDWRLNTCTGNAAFCTRSNDIIISISTACNVLPLISSCRYTLYIAKWHWQETCPYLLDRCFGRLSLQFIFKLFTFCSKILFHKRKHNQFFLALKLRH